MPRTTPRLPVPVRSTPITSSTWRPSSRSQVGRRQAVLLTCTVSARWENSINTGSALSADYQVTPKGLTHVLTQVPEAPTIGEAAAGGKNATVHWTVGASPDAPLSSFAVTPY